MNKLGVLLGAVVLGLAFSAAPMPLKVVLQDPIRYVTIYPNLLFAVPLILLGVLLILYGVTANAS
jgi:hypothetical protein